MVEAVFINLSSSPRCGKSIEKCFEHFTAIKSGNCYRPRFAHFLSHWEMGAHLASAPAKFLRATLHWLQFDRSFSSCPAALGYILSDRQILNNSHFQNFCWGVRASETELEGLVPLPPWRRTAGVWNKTVNPCASALTNYYFFNIASSPTLGYKERWWDLASKACDLLQFTNLNEGEINDDIFRK